MESDLIPRGFFHGSEQGGGYGLGFDVALRALVPILDLGWGIEESWSMLGFGGSFTAWCSRCFLGAFSCWKVTFLRKSLFDGLSWVGPDELSGLTGKSV